MAFLGFLRKFASYTELRSLSAVSGLVVQLLRVPLMWLTICLCASPVVKVADRSGRVGQHWPSGDNRLPLAT